MSSRRIYIDTNVLVNYFTKQIDDVQCLEYLFTKVRKEILFTSSLAVVQVVSILQTKKKGRESFTRKKAVESGEKIYTKFSIIDLSEKDVVEGFELQNEDVEDNVHFVLSKKMKCDVIVTNNTSDFVFFRNKIITLTPKDLNKVKRFVR
jgi:predicted nucleic acid-binding protein